MITRKYLNIIFLVLFFILSTPFQVFSQNTNSNDVPTENDMPKFSVNSNKTNKIEDVDEKNPIDLKQPSNIQRTVEYDPYTGNYLIYVTVGKLKMSTPLILSPEEFRAFSLKQGMNTYWIKKNAETQSNFEDKFNLTDMHFNLGPAEKIFGPGGVQIKTQGSTELKFGIRRNNIQNYSIEERLRTTTSFDFDPRIQMNVNAKVGNKMSFNLNYNTESSFDFDQQLMKLTYNGNEDEIIKKIEAGNVTMPLNSSLIRGSSALFGIKTELQFGKLNIVTVLSQQNAEAKSVNSKGGSQLQEFDVDVDNYDANRHFFLSQYFRDTYNKNMQTLPHITSGVEITRIEVWVTNKRGKFDQSRNIIAFQDIAEPTKVDNSHWSLLGQQYPQNTANSLYNEVKAISGVRDIQQTTSNLDAALNGLDIHGGEDYDKIESARRLNESEFTVNKALGFISLKTSLRNDEILAVAYEYTLGGKVFQVGEFSTDGIEAPQTLIVKLLKGTSTSPANMVWDLMMKNIYYLGGLQVKQEKFQLNVQYKSDSTGVYLNYIPDGNIKNKMLLKVLQLDNLDSRNERRPDGKFDYVEGYTMQSNSGRVIFPVVEPFGAYLRQAIGNPALADKYCYQELYDSTKVVAQEFSEKNKFRLYGKYQASSGSVIRLNAMNVPRGSVTVTAGGQKLMENVDYTVDYMMGSVTILNQSIIASGNNIEVNLESQSMFSMTRKTLLGTHMEYAFNKDISIGATVMHMSEMPIVTKTQMGSEPISNTIWGINAAYRTDAQWLTKAIDALPLLEASAPSTISANGEFAQLIPGHKEIKNNPGYAYLDDFESAQTSIDLRYFYYWHLASIPNDPTGGLFSEASLINNAEINKNRALLSWYSIDNAVFNRSNSSLMPGHIRRDKDLQSNHLTRQIPEKEIFPNKDIMAGQASYISVLNVSYYPEERGPYNLSTDINSQGKLNTPKTHWGGMMRKIETTDFEQANIEYIEFWMMDPFVNDPNASQTGGDLYIDLGNVSEDVLKDGKKFFENGLPADGVKNERNSEQTIWGYAPRVQSTVLAFDADANSRQYQDVGFNGLRSQDESTFPLYANYINQIKTIITDQSILEKFLLDPAGDDYHFYRGSDYDAEEVNILDRYKYFNGPEGNSPASGSDGESYATASTTIPDAEDINQDNTLSEYEKYFRYKINIDHNEMEVGKNFITNKVTNDVKLVNGTTSPCTWYQFKIPIHEFEKRVGSIRDFKSIRFMRMYMTDFDHPVHLRFGSLELVRGDWRTYTKNLFDIHNPPTTDGAITVSAVNIEENNRKQPVNYVLPPGVTRETDPGQPQMTQQNEQSMMLKVTNLAPGDARAVYKNITYDMRQYGRLQMYTHAEKIIDGLPITDNEMTLFIRIGSDHTQNFYEYEIPLQLTEPGVYNINTADQVWPKNNMLDFNLKTLTNVKNRRNKNGSKKGTLNMMIPYSEYDPANLRNKITIVGNPNLGEVETILIGVRNQGTAAKDIEVWCNELRLTEFNEDGGWGAVGNLAVNLSDLGSVNLSGHYESAGFGGIEQSVQERRMDDLAQYNFATTFDAGRFFPEKSKIRIPLYYSYGIDKTTPKYNPLDGDILLQDAMDNLSSESEKDSLRSLSETKTITESFNVTNMKVDIRGKRPKMYDPANISMSYAYTKTQELNPETERNQTKDYTASLNYNFNTSPKAWEPFKRSKIFKGKNWRIINGIGFYYIPKTIQFNLNIHRHYSETQLRDLTGGYAINKKDAYNPLLSNSKDFTWSRKFVINYDPMKNLKLSLNTATNSRIEETLYTPVNQDFFPDEYKNWKDTVMRSIANGGQPLTYQQIFTVNYDLPINKIPYLEFITARGQYNATYNWNAGVNFDPTIEMGNTISNLNNWQVNSKLDFLKLYNKSNRLKKLNQKSSSSRMNSRMALPGRPNQEPKKFRAKTYSKEITLNIDKKTNISHRLGTEKLHVAFTDKDGKPLQLKYKTVDRNTLEIQPNGMSSIRLSIKTMDPNKHNLSEKIINNTLRFMMMVRNVNFAYKETSSLTLPGFRPDASILGQNHLSGMNAPGYDFAFGMPDDSYINKAIDNNWLIINDKVATPALYNRTTDLDLKATIEPINGLKIDLNAKRVTSDQNNIQYMYAGMPTTYSGSFRQTFIAINTSFWGKGSASNNYKSKAFDNFMDNRHIVQSKLNQEYFGTKYPNNGFMEDNNNAGKTFNTQTGEFNLNSPDVLIPAFLAAYSDRSVNSIGTSPFLALSQLLPNWKITYDGLTNIDFISKRFKKVTLSHAYQCTYNVGAFSSYANYIENGDGLGFVRDVTSGDPIPSMKYDIATVSITENFGPFLGVDVAFNNNITAKMEYRRQRNLSLNLASNQIMEASNNEYVVGLGYVIKDFDMILKLKDNRQKRVKNDLTTRLDFSYKDISTLLRKIDPPANDALGANQQVAGDNQPTNGNKTMTVKFTADYVFSQRLNFRFFCDYQTNTPYISTSYPMSNTNVGFSIKLMLTR